MADLTSLWHFNRPKLTEQLGRRLAGQARIAMFGHRQTGKTTLLRQELMPSLERSGVLAIYIECWADKSKPLASMNYALTKAWESLTLPPAKGLGRLANTPVQKLSFAGSSIELAGAQARTLPDSPYLRFDALLTRLIEASQRPLVLIFDEFQAIAEVADADAIASALRAALTQTSEQVGAVFSGSSQTLLLEMFSRTKAPLYGFADATPYPLLKEDFIGHVATRFAASTGRELNQALSLRVLEQLGHQPEPFLNAVANAMSNPGWSVEDGLNAMLNPTIANKWSTNWFALTDLQRMALRLAHEAEPATAAASLQRAAAELAMPKVQPSSMTRALEGLTDKGLLERQAHTRRYEVADPVMRVWLERNRALPVKVG